MVFRNKYNMEKCKATPGVFNTHRSICAGFQILSLALFILFFHPFSNFLNKSFQSFTLHAVGVYWKPSFIMEIWIDNYRRNPT